MIDKYIKVIISIHFHTNLLTFFFSQMSQDFIIQGLLGESDFDSIKTVIPNIVAIKSYWLDKNTNRVANFINCCTGVIINHQFLLTAAHNIYNNQTQKFCTYLDIYFNFDNRGKILQTGQKERIVISGNPNYRCEIVKVGGQRIWKEDLALIKMDTNRREEINRTGNQIKCLEGFPAYQKSAKEGKEKKITTAFIIGFPDLSQNYQPIGNRGGLQILALLREDVAVISFVQTNFVYYECKTLKGQSGAPILIKNKISQSQDEWLLLGIHIAYSYPSSIGRGVLFTRQIVSMIRNWSSELSNEIEFVRYKQLKIADNNKVETAPETKMRVITNSILQLIEELQLTQDKSIIYEYSKLKSVCQKMIQTINKKLENLHQQLNSSLQFIRSYDNFKYGDYSDISQRIIENRLQNLNIGAQIQQYFNESLRLENYSSIQQNSEFLIEISQQKYFSESFQQSVDKSQNLIKIEQVCQVPGRMKSISSEKAKNEYRYRQIMAQLRQQEH